MNWEAIKHIYRAVLIHGRKIEYLGGDKYKLIHFYLTGEKYWEAVCKNGKLHGKLTGWKKNGNKFWEHEYENGI